MIRISRKKTLLNMPLRDDTAAVVGVESLTPGLTRLTSDDFISFDDIIARDDSTFEDVELMQEELMLDDKTALGKMVGKLHVSPPELPFSGMQHVCPSASQLSALLRACSSSGPRLALRDDSEQYQQQGFHCV